MWKKVWEVLYKRSHFSDKAECTKMHVHFHFIKFVFDATTIYSVLDFAAIIPHEHISKGVKIQ